MIRSRAWLAAALVAANAMGFSGSAVAAPQIEITQRTLDLGTIAPGEVSEGQIAARNVGDAPLVFGAARIVSEQVRGGAARDTLEPGGETHLRLAVLPAEPGAFEAKVIFPTNDPAQQTIIIVLRAQVAPRYELDRVSRPLGLLRPGEKSNTEIRIRFRAGLGARLVGAKAEPAFVHLTTRPGADSLEAIVAMAIGKDAPRGAFSGDAALFVSIPHPETLHVQITGEVAGRWHVIPPSFVIRRSRFRARAAPSVLCKRVEKKPARVIAASTDVPGYKTVVEVVEEGRVYRVRLLPEAGWKVGEWRGTVTIKTDDPAEREVAVPVSVVVAPTD